MDARDTTLRTHKAKAKWDRAAQRGAVSLLSKPRSTVCGHHGRMGHTLQRMGARWHRRQTPPLCPAHLGPASEQTLNSLYPECWLVLVGGFGVGLGGWHDIHI